MRCAPAFVLSLTRAARRASLLGTLVALLKRHITPRHVSSSFAPPPIAQVKYDVRKNFADSRMRVKGRFVKKEDEELLRELMSIT